MSVVIGLMVVSILISFKGKVARTVLRCLSSKASGANP